MMKKPPAQQNKQNALLYSAVLQQSHDGIVIINNKGIIQKINPAIHRIFGYDESELLNKNIRILMPEPYASEHDGYLENYIETRQEKILNRHVKLKAIKKSGEIFPIELSVSEIFCEDEQLFSGLIKDISAEEKAKQELQKSYQMLENSNKELESFAYSISHDLRTPLRGIDGFSLALLEDFADELPEEALSYIERIRANANKMGDMISCLLDLSRHSQQPIRYENFDLSALVKKSFDQLTESIPESRDIQFNCQESIMVSADPKLFSIVIDNLLGNALKYTQKEKQTIIDFGLQSTGDQKIYFIRDNGAGFDMRHKDKLFQVFQRLHRPHEFKGHGIGLATTQRIIQRHCGRIWAESEPGQGATFYFTLEQ